MRVHLKVIEGERERIQVFEAPLFAEAVVASGDLYCSWVSQGIGVERTSAPFTRIAKIEVTQERRRAKLYYLRDRVGKAARVAEAPEVRIDAIELSREKWAPSGPLFLIRRLIRCRGNLRSGSLYRQLR